MKTKLLVSLIIATTLLCTTSCKKDSSADTNTEYYVKIKKDGAWINYPTTAGELGPDLLNGALTDLGVRGQSANSDEIFDLDIQVKGTTFSPGIYNSDNSNYQTVISLTLVSGSNLSNFDIEDAPGMSASKYTVTISSITADAITGTFQGNYLYDSFGSTSPVANITEGEFHVKRIR